MGYWEDRQAATQAALTKKNIKQTEKQLLKYYETCIHSLRGSFLSTYNHLKNSVESGREPTPADLYKLNKYWELQTQLQHDLQKLGDKQIALYSKRFQEQWEDIYNAWAVTDDKHYTHMDKQAAQQMINEIWCADGQNWSNRVWGNTNKLQQALNDGLIDCVLTGKNPAQLREMLMSEFSVSWNNADMIVRTEMAHIQTKAAEQRYKDMGVNKVKVWADEDERRCKECGKLHEKIFMIGEKIPVPAHPRCRCCIVPVIE